MKVGEQGWRREERGGEDQWAHVASFLLPPTVDYEVAILSV